MLGRSYQRAFSGRLRFHKLGSPNVRQYRSVGNQLRSWARRAQYRVQTRRFGNLGHYPRWGGGAWRSNWQLRRRRF